MRPFWSTPAIAIGVELKKRVKRISEARSSAEASSPCVRLSTMVRRRAGAPVAGRRDAVHEAHRQRLAGDRREVEVDDGVARRAGIGLDRADQRHAVAGDDFRQRGGARREAREVDAEPFGKRRVDIGDAALLVGGEEAGRRMVEMVDRLLQVEEEALLLGALARDVGELPGEQRLALAGHAEGARPQPVPARAGLGAGPDRLRQPELAVAGLAVAQPGGQPVDDRRGFRHVRQQAFHGLDVGGVGGAGHVGIGAVGVDDPALRVGDDQALRHRIDERLGQFVVGRARRELHEADRGREQIADADHGEHAEHAEQEGIAKPLAEKRKDDRRAGQHEEEDDQPRDRRRAACPGRRSAPDRNRRGFSLAIRPTASGDADPLLPRPVESYSPWRGKGLAENCAVEKPLRCIAGRPLPDAMKRNLR